MYFFPLLWYVINVQQQDVKKKKLSEYITRFQVTLFFFAVISINKLYLKDQGAVNFLLLIT